MKKPLALSLLFLLSHSTYASGVKAVSKLAEEAALAAKKAVTHVEVSKVAPKNAVAVFGKYDFIKQTSKEMALVEKRKVQARELHDVLKGKKTEFETIGQPSKEAERIFNKLGPDDGESIWSYIGYESLIHNVDLDQYAYIGKNSNGRAIFMTAVPGDGFQSKGELRVLILRKITNAESKARFSGDWQFKGRLFQEGERSFERAVTNAYKSHNKKIPDFYHSGIDHNVNDFIVHDYARFHFRITDDGIDESLLADIIKNLL